jgi:UTP--glucose-1-phosphate uridylyltransferase
MKKSDALKMFDSAADLGRALGLSRSRICQWPEELTQKQADLVIGAAIRLGKISPQIAREIVRDSAAA